jgi:hypothetical protein
MNTRKGNLEMDINTMHGNNHRGLEMSSSVVNQSNADGSAIGNPQHHQNIMVNDSNPNHMGNNVYGISRNDRFEMPLTHDNYGDTLPSWRRQNGIYATTEGNQNPQHLNCHGNYYRDHAFGMSSGQDLEVNSNQPPEMSIANNDFDCYHQPRFFTDDNTMQRPTTGGTKSSWNGIGENSIYAFQPGHEHDRRFVDHQYSQQNMNMIDPQFIQQQRRQEERHSPHHGGGDPRFGMYPQQMYQRSTQNGEDSRYRTKMITPPHGKHNSSSKVIMYQRSPPATMLSPNPTTNRHSNSHHLRRGGGGDGGSKRRYLRPAISAQCSRSPWVGPNHSTSSIHQSYPQHTTTGATSTVSITHPQISGPRSWHHRQQSLSSNMSSSWKPPSAPQIMTPPPYHGHHYAGTSIAAPNHGGRILRSPTQRYYTRPPQQESSSSGAQVAAPLLVGHHHTSPFYDQDNDNYGYLGSYYNHPTITATSEQEPTDYFGQCLGGNNPFEEFSFRGGD